MFQHISRKLGCGPPSQDAIVANQGFFISGIPQISKNLTTVTSGGDEKNGILGFSGVHSLKPDDSNFAVLKMGPFDPKEVSFSKAMGHLGSLGTGKMGVVSQIPSLET